MFLDLQAWLPFLSSLLCGDKSHFLPGLWMLWWDDRWDSWMADILAVFIRKLWLRVGVLQWRPALWVSGEGLQWCVVLTIILSLAGRGNEALKWLFACPEEVILLHTGVCVVSGPVEAIPMCCPWIRDSEELIIRLRDAEVLVGLLDGGLGMVWHRGEGGRGLKVVFKVCRVSSETLCPAGSLGERNQNQKKSD